MICRLLNLTVIHVYCATHILLWGNMFLSGIFHQMCLLAVLLSIGARHTQIASKALLHTIFLFLWAIKRAQHFSPDEKRAQYTKLSQGGTAAPACVRTMHESLRVTYLYHPFQRINSPGKISHLSLEAEFSENACKWTH